MATNNSEKGPARKSAAKKATTPRKSPVKKTAAKGTTAMTSSTARTAKTTAKKRPAAKKVETRAAAADPLVSAAQNAWTTGTIGETTSDTQVIARVDIGFGNTLYIRGNGPGLSWDAGVAMQNTGPSEWIWSSRGASSEFEVKLLINDQTWETGPNTVVPASQTCVIEPRF